ncbi:MAG TPA: ATP-binding protein [Saprospiraceae bacterium]|nr:ATP-binding protein [Saprospiraceae bacterium]
MQYIVLTGPESTGKTTLAIQLRKAFSLPMVPEYARQYLSDMKKPYTLIDLEDIARKQTQMENELGKNFKTIICDTDLLTIIIWALEKFGECPEWIVDKWKSQNHRGYLLCLPDIEWHHDEQRENPVDREVIFEKYKKWLMENGKEFHMIYGMDQTRFANAARAVRSMRK